MKPAVMQRGSAPPTARSLTVPLTASSPMSPPGKKMGETTYESVVTARVVPPTSRSAWSPDGFPKAGWKSASTSVWVALPPAPWAMLIASSRILGARRRTDSIRSSTSCSDHLPTRDE